MSLSLLIDTLIANGGTLEQVQAIVRAHEAARSIKDPPWQETKRAVFERDGFVCAYCGIVGESSKGFDIDHIVARIHGGRSVMDNLTVACRPCNRSKKDRSLGKWKGRHGHQR